jgi:carbon storage regulator CsrA
MLVLTRKNKESVMVGAHDEFGRMVKVTVLQIRGRTVRLGFEGPIEIEVQRLEVWERSLSACDRAGASFTPSLAIAAIRPSD